jgi:diguanylate cyclase (GGDEF)-like protein
VLRHVAVFSDISYLKAQESELSRIAHYDALTGVPNRVLLADRLGQAMSASKRNRHYGAVMFLDLDNFKPINDAYGHNMGDLLLIELAQRITRCVRGMDTVARFGGDEFVVLLGELDEDYELSAAQARVVAEKIRMALAAPFLLERKGEGQEEARVECHCTASIGVALFMGHDAGKDDILKWADMAMYQAKESGRNDVRFFDLQRKHAA